MGGSKRQRTEKKGTLMPEDYGQGYGSYPQQPNPQQPDPQMVNPQMPMPTQPDPYGYGGYGQGQPPMDGQVPANGQQYGYPGGMPPKKGLGIGAIIGIVAGVLALVGILVFFLLSSGNKNKPADNQKDTPAAVSVDDEKNTNTKTPENEGATSQEDTNVTEETPTTPAAPSAPAGAGASQSGTAVDINNLSDDWTLCEVNLAGHGYRLYESTYGDLIANGWRLSEMSQNNVASKGGSLIVNVGEWTTLTMENPQYPDTSLTIGVANTSEAPINYDQGTLCYMSANKPPYLESPMYEFVVSKGMTFGKSDADVIGAIGIPEDGNMHEDTNFKNIRYTVRDTEKGRRSLEFTLTAPNGGPLQVTTIAIGS